MGKLQIFNQRAEHSGGDCYNISLGRCEPRLVLLCPFHVVRLVEQNAIARDLGFTAIRFGQIDAMPANFAASQFVAWAKAWGAILDFNCALILLPVCRTFIRYLYDFSTQSQVLNFPCFDRIHLNFSWCRPDRSVSYAVFLPLSR